MNSLLTKRPLIFATFLTTFFIVVDLIVKTNFLLPVLFSTLVLSIYFFKQYGIDKGFSLILIYLLLFDNESFIFTSLQFRLWYFVLLLYLSYLVFKYVINYKSIKFVYNINFLLFIMLIGISISYLLVDSLAFKIHNIKYWLFYIGLIITLYKNLMTFNTPELNSNLITYFISLSLFVAMSGLLQFITTVLGHPLLGTYFRPQAFFSETTWFSEYLVFGILLIFFQMRNLNKKYYLLYVYLCLCGIIVSATRNSFLAIGIVLIFNFFINIIRLKINLNIFKNVFFYLGIIIIIALVITFWDILNELVFSKIIRKFDLNEASASSRLTALTWSIKNLKTSPLLGNGFYWDGSMITKWGTALGSKSFNLFFMIFWLFGIYGFLPFFIMLFVFMVKNFWKYMLTGKKTFLLSLNIMLCFLSISMFAPLHQYSFGMYTVALSIYFYKIGYNNEISFCNAKN